MDNNQIKDCIQFLHHNPLSIWVTGLSGSGKTTLANHVSTLFSEYAVNIRILDGDHLRKGLNNNLGFSIADRTENIRRAAEVSKLFNESGITTINAFICPTNELRNQAKKIVGTEKYFEIYLDVPFNICEQRDPKGLYARFRKGEFRELTGFDSPYEVPENHDLILKTYLETPKESAKRTFESILGYICKIKR
ncbi:MAG TPA: adenylyl-sulfate kinase [Bacteroidales bacterium]|nr:adenylyl-sulfate kinase [Bacteroidales bacterium]